LICRLLVNHPKGNEMNILITGSNGFIAKNLIHALKSSNACSINLLLVNSSTTDLEVELALIKADILVHLAAVHRPKIVDEYYTVNEHFTEKIINLLLKNNKKIPVIFSSSKQVLVDNDYGKSKLKAELILSEYFKITGARVHILRLPNVFGKWAKPNSNSVVSTFCYNVSRSLPIDIHNESNTVSLLHIDEVVSLMIQLITNPEKINPYEDFPSIVEITVGELAKKINEFNDLRNKNQLPTIQSRFDQQLFSTYTSYLPLEGLRMERLTNESPGSRFTELIQTIHSGQFSLNIIQPGVVKGNHWHQTKHEKYFVIQGTAKIRLRKKFDENVDEIILGSEPIASLDIPPGVVHSIENFGQQDLITIMWANEMYDPKNPDTFKEDV